MTSRAILLVFSGASPPPRAHPRPARTRAGRTPAGPPTRGPSRTRARASKPARIRRLEANRTPGAARTPARTTTRAPRRTRAHSRSTQTPSPARAALPRSASVSSRCRRGAAGSPTTRPRPCSTRRRRGEAPRAERRRVCALRRRVRLQLRRRGGVRLRRRMRAAPLARGGPLPAPAPPARKSSGSRRATSPARWRGRLLCPARRSSWSSLPTGWSCA